MLKFIIINILLLCYNDIITITLKMFAFLKVDEERLLSDYSIKLFSTQHRNWLIFGAIPILLIVGIGYPLAMIILLSYKKQTKNALDARKNLFQYGFLYFAYER